MTTSPKLLSKLPASHGLTGRLCDALYDAKSKGQPTEYIWAAVRIRVKGHGEDDGKQFVSFAVEDLEIAPDAFERDNLRAIIAKASDTRHGAQTLPLDWPSRNDEEQRRWLFSLIDEWAAEEGKLPGEVAEAWRDYFGIDVGASDTPAGYAPVDYRKADAHRLREFCLNVGVLADDDGAGAPIDGDTSDEVADPGTVQVSDVDELETVDA